ncbi:unnamed protein product [Fusarium fujikuroi]|nr:unnamed protein product [Fusarium fujikuroi]VZI16447.1 unnamed protein product [Fusarium fujikuroi]
MKKNQILLGRARDESGEPIERFMRRDKIYAKIVPSIENLLILWINSEVLFRRINEANDILLRTAADEDGRLIDKDDFKEKMH